MKDLLPKSLFRTARCAPLNENFGNVWFLIMLFTTVFYEDKSRSKLNVTKLKSCKGLTV